MHADDRSRNTSNSWDGNLVKKILLAGPSGLDSTFLLYRLLTESNDHVQCFWMDLSHIVYPDKNGNPVRYNHDLCPAESIIAPRVIDWLFTHVRPVSFEVVRGVKYIPTPADFPGGNARGWRVWPMLIEAAKIMSRDGLDEFVYGKSPENLRTAGQGARDRWYQAWWKDNAPKGSKFRTPLLEANQGRPHALQGLPTALLSIVLTCNDPRIVNGEPEICGTCDKCQLTAESRRLMAEGVSADDALDYLLRLRNAGPYIESLVIPDKRFGGGVTPSKFPPYS